MLNHNEQKEVSEVLSSFGLKEKEQAVYLALGGTPQSSSTELARQVGFPATTVEAILARLHTDGLVSITKQKSRRRYSAHGVATLKQILLRKVEDITRIAPLFEKMLDQKKSDMKVEIFLRERIADILHLALLSKNKTIFEIVAAADFQEVIGEKFHFSRRRVAAGVKLKSLRVEKQEIKKYSRQTHVRELREARFLPRELTFATTFLMWDTSVAIISPKAEGTAVLIRSSSLSVTMQQIFDLLWSVSRSMETARED